MPQNFLTCYPSQGSKAVAELRSMFVLALVLGSSCFVFGRDDNTLLCGFFKLKRNAQIITINILGIIMNTVDTIAPIGNLNIYFNIIFTSLALLGLVFIFLSLNVIKHRRKNQVLYGANKDISMQAAIRAQGNFIEYVPLTFLLFFGLIYYQVPVWFFAILNFVFIVARCLHGIGLIKYERRDPPCIKPRFGGMVLTFLVLLISNIYILFNIVSRVFFLSFL